MGDQIDRQDSLSAGFAYCAVLRMKITVQRRLLTPQSTEGDLYLDGGWECYTLEPPVLPPPTKPRAISAGTFHWEKRMSPHFGFETVWVLNVPDFEDIEIHPGNMPANTLGCTLVGSIQQQNFVGHSQEEFARLMSLLPASGTVEYLDPVAPNSQPNNQVA